MSAKGADVGHEGVLPRDSADDGRCCIIGGGARTGSGCEVAMNEETFLAALRHDRIDAPWLIEGPINGQRFKIYVEQVLLPTLQPGDIVVIDNLGSHKGKVIRQALRAAGVKLFFLPKYSPDLNPIEQVFSKLKHLLRKAAQRTLEAICAAIGQILGTYTSQECANYFKNSGYRA